MAWLSKVARTFNRSTMCASTVSRQCNTISQESWNCNVFATTTSKAPPPCAPAGPNRQVKHTAPPTDVVLDSLFSQHFPLPHWDIYEATPASFEAFLPGQLYSPQDDPTYPFLLPLEMARNSRKPAKANHGKRPCSRVSRRGKKEKFGNRKR